MVVDHSLIAGNPFVLPQNPDSSQWSIVKGIVQETLRTKEDGPSKACYQR